MSDYTDNLLKQLAFIVGNDAIDNEITKMKKAEMVDSTFIMGSNSRNALIEYMTGFIRANIIKHNMVLERLNYNAAANFITEKCSIPLRYMICGFILGYKSGVKEIDRP